MSTSMITTTDNPYNPYDNYKAWYEFDRAAGYDTPSYLARVVRTSDELSDSDQSQAIEDAIDEIIEHNPLGIYVKVSTPE